MENPSPREKFLQVALEKGYVTLDGLLSLIDDYAAQRTPPEGGFAAISSRRGENNLDAPPGRTAN
jgi:hypothetical protein